MFYPESYNTEKVATPCNRIKEIDERREIL
jgi:hypothetical protein